MSLDPLEIWAFRYKLKCAPRPRMDLDENLGTLPDYTIYIGSSMNTQTRLCLHFTPGKGCRWTIAMPPSAVLSVDATKPTSTCNCLAMEDNDTIDCMFELMTTYTHPEAWRCCGGGSWARADNKRMPAPLRHKLNERQRLSHQ